MSNHRVIILTKHFPTSVNAGNLVYLKFMIDLFQEKVDELLVIVVGDRFADHEYAIKDPSTNTVRYVTTFSKVFNGNHILWGHKYWLKNIPRSVWLRLPSRLRQVVAHLHFSFKSRRAPTAPLPQADPNVSVSALDKHALKLLASSMEQFKPTHVFIDRTELFEYLPYVSLKNVRTGILCHDLVSKRHSDAAAVGLVADMEFISELSELGKLAAVDSVISIQRNESKQIAELVNGHVAYIPYLARVARERDGSGQEVADRLLFVGSGGAPNITGITWFLEVIWPKVLARNPFATMDVVGAVGNFVKHDAERVEFHGKVADVQPFYRSASVVVVPLRIGSGLKIKLVEALAEGAPCITTSVGAQGLEAGADHAFLVADDPDAFAQKVLDLLQDSTHRASLSSQAKNFTALHFDRPAALAALERALEAPALAERDRVCLAKAAWTEPVPELGIGST